MDSKVRIRKGGTWERSVTLYNRALKDAAAKAQADAEGRLRLPETQQTKTRDSGLQDRKRQNSGEVKKQNKGAFSQAEADAVQKIQGKA